MNETNTKQWTWQFWAAAVIVIGFAVLVVIMFSNATGTEIVWQRRVYLFGAVEAVVFTAVGWIFGREVHRSAAASAEQDASAAKKDAEAARTEAKQSSAQAAAAEQLAAEEAIKGKAVHAAVESMTRTGPSGGPRDVGLNGPAGHDATVSQLRDFVARLYG